MLNARMSPGLYNLLRVLPLVVWEAVWKGIGLWKAARNSQRNWFIALLLLNTACILPIVYIKFFQAKPK